MILPNFHRIEKSIFILTFLKKILIYFSPVVEDCDFQAKEKMQFVQHYIGKRHGILEKYISEELQNRENNDPDLSEVAVLLANISNQNNEPFKDIKNIKEETIINEPVDDVIKEAEQEIQNFSSKSLLTPEESDEQINNEMNEILENFRENDFTKNNIDEENSADEDDVQKMSDSTPIGKKHALNFFLTFRSKY